MTMPLFGAEQGALTTDDYYTPAWLFETMAITFDLDVASPPGGVPWIPATRYLTMADDGLSSPWEGRVWMNPPYGDVEPWIERFINHNHGVALIPLTNSKWFDRLWRTKVSLCTPGYDFKFVREGMRTDIRWRVLLAAFGDECVEAIARVGKVR